MAAQLAPWTTSARREARSRPQTELRPGSERALWPATTLAHALPLESMPKGMRQGAEPTTDPSDTTSSLRSLSSPKILLSRRTQNRQSSSSSPSKSARPCKRATVATYPRRSEIPERRCLPGSARFGQTLLRPARTAAVDKRLLRRGESRALRPRPTSSTILRVFMTE